MDMKQIGRNITTLIKNGGFTFYKRQLSKLFTKSGLLKIHQLFNWFYG